MIIVHPDEYRQSRVEAIRKMVYGYGLNLLEIRRKMNVSIDNHYNIVNPWRKVKACTLDDWYHTICQYVIVFTEHSPIKVPGRNYKEYSEYMMNTIIGYYRNSRHTVHTLSRLTGFSETQCSKYVRGVCMPKIDKLYTAYIAVQHEKSLL